MSSPTSLEYFVPEVLDFRTSKTCNCCKQRAFEHMYSVLHCKTSDWLSTTVNRDVGNARVAPFCNVNASRNILDLTQALLAGQPRPECFLRGANDF